MLQIKSLVSTHPLCALFFYAGFVIVTDSKTCADVLNGVDKPHHQDTAFTNIAFETIRGLMRVQIKAKVSVVWVPRNENQRADWIASWARVSGRGSDVWVDWETMLGRLSDCYWNLVVLSYLRH